MTTFCSHFRCTMKSHSVVGGGREKGRRGRKRRERGRDDNGERRKRAKEVEAQREGTREDKGERGKGGEVKMGERKDM